MRYPAPLGKNGTIGVTAPSSGVDADCHPRLEVALSHLQSLGYRIREGRCLRENRKAQSADRRERAADFLALWNDPTVDALMPPWGGIRLIEILPLIDFRRLADGDATWVQGWSDISTLLFPLTILTDIATIHGTNLMDQVPNQPDPLTRGSLVALTAPTGAAFIQESSERFATGFGDYAKDPRTVYEPTQPTRWRALGPSPDRALDIEGRLIGGCLDTLATLVGTPYGDLARFKQRYAGDGVVLYLENCGQRPTDASRILWAMRLAGWFDGLAGLVLGRNAAPDASRPEHPTYAELVDAALGDLGVPVLVDADIGHLPPQMTLVNGALATFSYADGRATLTQTLA